MRELTKEEWKLINSKAGLIRLLSEKQPDFASVATQLQLEKRIHDLQIQLIKMQSWIVRRHKRLIILFEGRDFAGKSSAIRKFAEHLNPRNMRILAFPQPTAMEKRQWYFRRYIQGFPSPGEIVFFDRSWYNRAVVEPVNNFCSRNKYRKFMSEVNQFEEIIMNDGIQLIKFYFSISREEQIRRIEEIKSNPLKKWKLTPVDERAVELWDDYTLYKDKMFAETNRNNSPWVVIDANNHLEASIEAMEYVLSQVAFR